MRASTAGYDRIESLGNRRRKLGYVHLNVFYSSLSGRWVLEVCGSAFVISDIGTCSQCAGISETGT